MATSASYTADSSFSSNYSPSDSTTSWVEIGGDGTTFRIANARTPSSSSATGIVGEIIWDASYIYVCTAVNTWKRIALNTF